ncbi:MAG: hypothetical protein R3B13_13015 [Polyangiaceae bacterium]
MIRWASIGVAAACFSLGCGDSGSSDGNSGGSGNAAGSGGGGNAAGTGGSGNAAGSGGSGNAAGTGGAPGGSGGSGNAAGSGGGGALSSKARDVATALGRSPNFLIGMGNDLDNNHDNDGAYTLGVTLDLHYAYLVGLKGQGGWTDWNAGGTFVNILTDSAKKHGVTPMFTLYSMAAWGEANTSTLVNDEYMQAYWDGAKLLFERLAVFNEPAVVHFEPDFWAYAQQASKSNPSSLPVHVGSLAPDCAGQPDNMVGMGHCLVALARKYAPKAVIGFHASRWADPDPSKVAKFLVDIGAGQADIVVLETLDRDAGCFEKHTDPNCQRNDGPWYWDETNQTSPNFSEHLAWAKSIGTGVGRPLLWWQMPFGVPSASPGGSAGKYRDNRVKYLFEHPDEFVAAGGLGAVFGTGAGNQTYITTDGGQFKNAVTKYFQSPTPLP